MQIAEIQLFNSTNFDGILPYEHMTRFHSVLAPDNRSLVSMLHRRLEIQTAGFTPLSFMMEPPTQEVFISMVFLTGQGAKRPQNGGGHLIIGGRNNGEAQYRGLIDEVTVFTEALAAPEVAALQQAETQSFLFPTKTVTDSWMLGRPSMLRT